MVQFVGEFRPVRGGWAVELGGGMMRVWCGGEIVGEVPAEGVGEVTDELMAAWVARRAELGRPLTPEEMRGTLPVAVQE